MHSITNSPHPGKSLFHFLGPHYICASMSLHQSSPVSDNQFFKAYIKRGNMYNMRKRSERTRQQKRKCAYINWKVLSRFQNIEIRIKEDRKCLFYSGNGKSCIFQYISESFPSIVNVQGSCCSFLLCSLVYSEIYWKIRDFPFPE